MEFNSSFDQTNFMGYYPPSQYDSIHYLNGGWEYHQEVTDSEQSNQWGYTSEPQDEQDSFMRYCPTPQNDSCHYANAFTSSYSIYQEPTSLEHTFNSFMQNCPTSPPSSSFENSSSFDYASTQSFLNNPHNSSHQPHNLFHHTENSFQYSQNSFHTPQNNFTTTHPCPQDYFQSSSLELAEDLL
ncbi:hypothetical protein AHAS_Ahas14G0098400 [Arachis hypogaea]